jgi:hypothetical protein
MKRLSDAIEDFIASKASHTRERHGRRSNSPPRHYHHIRWLRSRPSDQVPRLASHYSCPLGEHFLSSISHRQLNGLLSDVGDPFPVTFLPTTQMLVVDTGASIMITPELSDFVEPPAPVQPTILCSIASGLSVQGIGTVAYTFYPTNDPPTQVQLPDVLHVPGCSARLLCPRHLEILMMVSCL